ncbi:poly-gamma-glutamate hydrolase family protein [Streptomyces sp. NPDC059875]|uniref:poly-gamma-glutamate hydrolase family protein n=1 Tax=unclassified Streptomyces TaxID=2593676 RepID=UPI0036495990
MNFTSRRTLLTSVAAAAASLPLINDLAGNGSTAAAATTEFSSNTVMYGDPARKEGVDWMRRYRCGAPTAFNDYAKDGPSAPVRSTAIIAPHGGGLEAGTSELCLTLAGYTLVDPGVEPQAVPGVPQRDYWMFETLTSPGQPLHVTSTNCDDPAALAVCGNNLYAVSLHGYSPDDNALAKRILIGGRDQRLIGNLAWAFNKHGLNSTLGVTVVVAGANAELNGDDPANIVNRTRTGAGAQLEISTELRRAMFGDFSGGAARRATAGAGAAAPYWNGFVAAVREALDLHESGRAS